MKYKENDLVVVIDGAPYNITTPGTLCKIVEDCHEIYVSVDYNGRIHHIEKKFIRPAGISKSSDLTGVKHDDGKPDMALLSGPALLEVAKVMTYGKKKYSAHNWRGGFIWSRPLSACLRHVWSFINGEDNDPETGLSHLAHAMCCLMFVLEFVLTGAGQDDRFKPKAKK